MKFSPESVAAFIAVLGILSIIAQVSLRQAPRVTSWRMGLAAIRLHPGWGPGGVALSGSVGYRLRNFTLSGS